MELIEFDLILLTFKLNSNLSIYILHHSAPPNMDHYLFSTIICFTNLTHGQLFRLWLGQVLRLWYTIFGHTRLIRATEMKITISSIKSCLLKLNFCQTAVYNNKNKKKSSIAPSMIVVHAIEFNIIIISLQNRKGYSLFHCTHRMKSRRGRQRGSRGRGACC